MTHPHIFSCPNCGHSVQLLAKGLTITAVCPACSSELDVNNARVTLVNAVHQQQQRVPERRIRTGTRGKLQGIEWQVIGFQQRRAQGADGPWQEYLLFNPYHGFRFLIEDYGNWSLAQVLPVAPRMEGIKYATVKIGDDFQRFFLYDRGYAKTTFVSGEFYWRAREGDQAYTKIFLALPTGMGLSEERVLAGGVVVESIWSLLYHLEGEEVASAFGIRELPESTFNPMQPYRLHGVYKTLARIGLIFLTALVLVAASIEFMTSKDLTDHVLVLKTCDNGLGPGQCTVQESFSAFTLDKPARSVLVGMAFEQDAPATVEIEAEGVLVHEESGATFPVWHWMWEEIYASVEGTHHYKGKSGPMLIRDLPAGHYVFNYKIAFKESGFGHLAFPLRITAIQHPVSWGLFWLCVILIVGAVAFAWIHERRYFWQRPELSLAKYAADNSDEEYY